MATPSPSISSESTHEQTIDENNSEASNANQDEAGDGRQDEAGGPGDHPIQTQLASYIVYCRALKTENISLKAEVERLKKEVATLKRRLEGQRNTKRVGVFNTLR